jgi:hypothetical protein
LDGKTEATGRPRTVAAKKQIPIEFTYIPGTVIHLGYGSLYEKLAWGDEDCIPSDRFLETKRSFFFKVSYLWRL